MFADAIHVFTDCRSRLAKLKRLKCLSRHKKCGFDNPNPAKSFSEKILNIFRSKSEKKIMKFYFVSRKKILKMFLWTRRKQFWQPCRKFFAKKPIILLKVRK